MLPVLRFFLKNVVTCSQQNTSDLSNIYYDQAAAKLINVLLPSNRNGDSGELSHTLICFMMLENRVGTIKYIMLNVFINDLFKKILNMSKM